MARLNVIQMYRDIKKTACKNPHNDLDCANRLRRGVKRPLGFFVIVAAAPIGDRTQCIALLLSYPGNRAN